ncbi:MAG: aminotransferase class III-fold pyridoxal phosphate-dependent enzyme [Ignavibacteriales bacterium]
MHPFADFVNPYLADLLSKIEMDKRFVRGEGCWLYDSSGRRYLDLIASYGALPFGFNPAGIWEAIDSVRRSGEPSFVQPSYLEAAGELAERLISIAPAGLRYVTFTNSGAEAAEAAIKMCRAATGRRRILAAKNSFHGKTLGALSATGKESYQRAFGAPVQGFDFVPYGDAAAVEEAFSRRAGEYAAFIVEPIQGEGGIVVPPPGYIKASRDLCSRHGVLFILDEIQTGLGRTGRLFACQEEDVSPDVMLLAKALGGGIVPIGAVLASEDAYTEEFANKHSSTFAGNTLACRVGIASLDILTGNDCMLLDNVRRNGEILKGGLDEMREQFPHVLRSVRGRGLMLGIQFGITRDTFRDSLLGVMAEQELLTPLISSYLLNAEGLRVAPTLNGSDVIRIEPPLIIDEQQCRSALDGIGRVIEILSRGCTARLLGHLAGGGIGGGVSGHCDGGGQAVLPARQRVRPGEDPSEGRFAFLVHPLDLRNYTEFDKSLRVFPDESLRELASRWNDLVDPFVLSETRIVSASGATAYGEFIAVPKTSEDLINGPREEVMGMLRDAVALARDRGARIVGLGAYTSIASRGGRHLLDEGVAITTGNSYTVVSAVEAVMTALSRLEIDPRRATMSVVGATGSIGRATTILLSEYAPRLILIGNPKWPERSRRRLLTVAAAVCRHLVSEMRRGRVFPAGSLAERIRLTAGLPVEDAADGAYEAVALEVESTSGAILLTTDVDRHLKVSDVVVTATSNIGALVTPHNVKRGAVVCDLSRPPNVSREVKDARADVLAIDGGVVAVPGLPSLGWDFGFEKGLAYACMAETMMLALAHHYDHMSIGADLNLEGIAYVRRLAAEHGFHIADLRSFDRPLTQREWQAVVEARESMAGTAALANG